MQGFGIGDGGEGFPFLPFRHAHMRLPFGHLRLGHQAAVVVFVARNRRAPAFDRIGEKAGGAVVVYGGEGFGHGLHAVAAEVFHQLRQFGIAAARDQGADLALIAQIIQQMLPPDRAALIGQRSIKLVRAGVDPIAQRVAARFGKGGALQGAVFDADHLPTEGLKYFFNTLEQTLAHDAVQRLAVIVDDPPSVAQIVFPAFLQTFVDIALVQFGIANQRHHAAQGQALPPSFRRDVVLHDRGEGGDRHAQAHRTRREIHIIAVFGAAGIALHAMIAAEVLHLLQRQIAHQILHGVEDRRGVGFHRHPIFGPQRREIQRRHDRHHRGAGGLMAADLDRIDFRADVVGVVDHPM